MKADIRVTHAIPGRIRLKIGALRANPALARRLEDRLAGAPGVRRAETNPGTGSLLLHYDEATEEWRDQAQALAQHLAPLSPRLDTHVMKQALTRADEPSNGAPLLEPHHVTGFFQSVNDTVAGTTGGMGLKLLVPVVLVLLGVRGFLAAETTAVPRWYDLLWFGFAAFVMLNGAGVPPTRAAEEAAELAAAV